MTTDSPAQVVLSLDATRDALDRAAEATRQGVARNIQTDTRRWADLEKFERQRFRRAVADCVEQLGDPVTAAALRAMIALLDHAGIGA